DSAAGLNNGGVPTSGRHVWASDDRNARRRELYQRAAPMLRVHGFGGSTLKALARACGVSVPALYRYFPSKRAFALYPLVALYPELHAPPPDLSSGDPRLHLVGWIDAAVEEMPNYTLALRLAREVGLDRAEQARIEANLTVHIDAVAVLARAAAPQLSEAASREVASAMISIATGSVLTGIEIEPASLRHRLRALLRGYGVVLPTTLPTER
ncbi:MAG TPA: TetR/AcrR family transcriptional regulator, partial [Microlunatus sp.]|nr:TetR/AcrR family transcriptional regulator [Microlunatus sp.]